MKLNRVLTVDESSSYIGSANPMEAFLEHANSREIGEQLDSWLFVSLACHSHDR